MKITRRTFIASALAGAAALALLTACGSGSGVNDWWISFPAMINSELKKQGSDTQLQTDKDLCDISEKIGSGTAAVWAQYGWDGASAESADILAAKSAAADASGIDYSTQALLKEISYVNGSGDSGKAHADEAAKQIVELSYSGKKYTKIGYTYIDYMNKTYIFIVIGQ